MGTPLTTDSRLLHIGHSFENLAGDLVNLLIDNYNSKNLSLGSAYNGTTTYSCFTLTDSEFENLFLALRFNGGSYSIEFKSDNADSPYAVNVELDELLSIQFPDGMKGELQEKYNQLFFQ